MKCSTCFRTFICYVVCEKRQTGCRGIYRIGKGWMRHSNTQTSMVWRGRLGERGKYHRGDRDDVQECVATGFRLNTHYDVGGFSEILITASSCLNIYVMSHRTKCITATNFTFFAYYLGDTRHPHSVLLNNDDLLLSWSIDWANEAVLMNVDNAFGPKHKFFTFGFTKWGREQQADLCLFDRDDWESEPAIVSV